MVKESLMVRLPSYKFSSVLFRVIVVSTVAVLLMLFLKSISPPKEHPGELPEIFYYFYVILIFNLLSEANILLDLIAEKFLPVPKMIRIRIGLQLVVSILLLTLIFVISRAILPMPENASKTPFYVAMAVGMTFVTMLAHILIIGRLTDKWIVSERQISQMKKDKLRMDYSMLQDKLNPHFLFNNLSVLKSLIYYDKDAAIHFTDNFTDVYRYVLTSADKMLVKLSGELEFIKSYIHLHKERLGDGLTVEFNIDKSSLDTSIAPLSLQLLFENAIKHNTASKDSPLHIEVSTTNNKLEVRNNLQLKDTSYSTNTGLKNLIQRYHLLTDQEVDVDETAQHFSVKIPLL